MFRTGWQMDYPRIENFLAPLYVTDASSNDGEYSNPEFDALIADGVSNADLAAGLQVFQEAEEILAEDMPVIPLWTTRQITGLRRDGEQRPGRPVLGDWSSRPSRRTDLIS